LNAWGDRERQCSTDEWRRHSHTHPHIEGRREERYFTARLLTPGGQLPKQESMTDQL
jgi:hypothetical protein